MSSERHSTVDADAAAAGVVRIYPTDALPHEAAALIARALTEAVRARGVASFMLAGGTTPRAMYEALAVHEGVPWDEIRVFFGDERAVGPTDPASNYAMARAALLDRVAIRPSAVFRMQADHPHLEEAARAYELLLPDAVDVVVLGIGVDGHTASLFPQAAALELRGKRVVSVVGPSAPALRLTVSPDVIRAARKRFVLAAGADKAPAVTNALDGPLDVRACPAQLARNGEWLLDVAAAGALSSRVQGDLARPKPAC